MNKTPSPSDGEAMADTTHADIDTTEKNALIGLKDITLPPKNKAETNNIRIANVSSLVIIGANGSGKTRFGYWIERNNITNAHVHRISAQRALKLPSFSKPVPYGEALKKLIYGENARESNFNHKLAFRWSKEPVTIILNDIELLLEVLFAEEAKHSVEFRKSAKALGALPEITDTLVDRLLNIWQAVLPHRKLVFEDYKVFAEPSSGTRYAGAEMSDGERVMLYMIGQALSAPENATLVIDEPELHIHKAILGKLWDKIEAVRPDCLFIYITHDLEFAATRKTAKKAWIKEFDGESWEWEMLPELDSIPDHILFNVAGSRNKVLFVEGKLDSSICEAAYPERTIIRAGSCSAVEELTKALSRVPELHYHEPAGIIDRDFRDSSELEELEKKGIQALEVAEIENLLCLEEIVKAIAVELKQDPETIFNSAKQIIMDEFSKDIENQVSRRTSYQIQAKLRRFGKKPIGKEQIISDFEEHIASIDAASLYDQNLQEFKQLLNAKDYEGILRVFNHKGAVKEISRLLGFNGNGYQDYILRLIKSEEGTEILEVIKRRLPEIPKNNTLAKV